MFGRKKQEDRELSFNLSDFEEKDQNEIEKIEKILEPSEIIKTVARQSRIVPGGSVVTPNIIFATNKRLIIGDPNTLGLRAGVESIPYSQINKVHMEKGAFSSELVMDVGQYETGDNEQIIPAIPKNKASEILGIINQYVRSSQNFDSHTPKVVAPKEDDPLKILKIRFAKGKISKEEYDEMKSALE